MALLTKRETPTKSMKTSKDVSAHTQTKSKKLDTNVDAQQVKFGTMPLSHVTVLEKAKSKLTVNVFAQVIWFSMVEAQENVFAHQLTISEAALLALAQPIKSTTLTQTLVSVLLQAKSKSMVFANA